MRASRDTPAGAAVQLSFNVSDADKNGNRQVRVKDVARPRHMPSKGTQLARMMNDTDIPAGDIPGKTTHHPASSGDTAATCQALCDADDECVAWVWVIRGLPIGSADCCLKSSVISCPNNRAVLPHPCNPCRLTSGVKRPSTCHQRLPPTDFNVTVLKEETLDVRLLVDRPIVEVYVQGGRGAFVVAANYSAANASVHLVNRGHVPVVANVSAWQMECGWAAQLPTPNVNNTGL